MPSIVQARNRGVEGLEEMERSLRRRIEARGLKLIKWQSKPEQSEGAGYVVADLDHGGAVFRHGTGPEDTATLVEVENWLAEEEATAL